MWGGACWYRYTPETVHSLNAVWNVLGTVLDDAEESLRGQILAQRDESITPEQIKEIKEVFEFFDQDRDDNLKVSEFRDCCTGIGMVMTDDELAATLAEIDADGNGCVWWFGQRRVCCRVPSPGRAVCLTR